MIEQDVPRLSLAAAVELRRIYCKHVVETLPTRELQELVETKCVAGRFVTAPDRFVVEQVTPIGVAALETRESTG